MRFSVEKGVRKSHSCCGYFSQFLFFLSGGGCARGVVKLRLCCGEKLEFLLSALFYFYIRVLRRDFFPFFFFCFFSFFSQIRASEGFTN